LIRPEVTGAIWRAKTENTRSSKLVDFESPAISPTARFLPTVIPPPTQSPPREKKRREEERRKQKRTEENRRQQKSTEEKRREAVSKPIVRRLKTPDPHHAASM
jgi:hypothetical protein